MRRMTTEEQVVIVLPDPLREFTTQVFASLGLSPQDSFIVADHMVEADLRGVYSHGMLLLNTYVQKIKSGGINPTPSIRIVRETAGTALVDGDNGAGHVVAARAMEIAIRKGKEAGTSHVGVRGSNHFGTCAYWAGMALSHDMIGFAASVGVTNIIAPTGGVTPLLGNNPFGVAIPAGKEYPLVLDMALSVVARGKIVHAMKTGTPVPSNWAVNKWGEPTTDAKEAYEGLIQPVGGYKGYGMAFVVGALGALLNGAAFLGGIVPFYSNFDKPQDASHFFSVIDIEAFIDPLEFKSRMDEAIQAMHSSELARGAERIYVPGEMEWLKRAERLKTGIQIPPAVWRDMEVISQDRAVPLPSGVQPQGV